MEKPDNCGAENPTLLTDQAHERYYYSLPLCERLRYLRQARELTQNDVAQLLCIDRSTYAYYETGKTEPRLTSMIALARFYGITLDTMLKGLLELESGGGTQSG